MMIHYCKSLLILTSVETSINPLIIFWLKALTLVFGIFLRRSPYILYIYINIYRLRVDYTVYSRRESRFLFIQEILLATFYAFKILDVLLDFVWEQLRKQTNLCLLFLWRWGIFGWSNLSKFLIKPAASESSIRLSYLSGSKNAAYIARVLLLLLLLFYFCWKDRQVGWARVSIVRIVQ